MSDSSSEAVASEAHGSQVNATPAPPPAIIPMSSKKSITENTSAATEADSAGAAEATSPKPVAATKPDSMQPDALEFIQAIDDYKRQAGRPFPSWSEILEIVKRLGYEREA